MEEVTSKIIREKILAFISFSFILGFMPPFSWMFFSIGLVTSVVAIITGIYGNYQRNKELTLLHYLSTFILIGFLLGLRFFHMAAKLSWNLIGWLLLGMLPIAILPFVDKKLSELLYREQVAPQTKIGRIIFTISLGIAPIIGVLGASWGRVLSRGGSSSSFIAIGYLMYFATLGGIFFSFHMYATDQFRWITRKK